MTFYFSSNTVLISFFLFLSGASALVYQVIWVRLLSLSVGASSISISIVLAAFFLGLGLGSYFTGVILQRFHNALKVYLIIEFFIALSALVLLPLLLNLDYFISLLPFSEVGIGFKFFVVILLLLIPTFLIGTTFALLMAVAISHRKEIGAKLAHFYALNTLGAVCGALVSGIVLIPHYGLDGTVYIAALLNIIIVLTGMVFYKLLKPKSKIYISENCNKEFYTLNNKALYVLFATGLSAMATEVGWMKFLIIYTGNTIYGFSLILSMFLLGLSIGSFVVKSHFLSKIAPDKFLFYGLIFLAIALVFARVGLAMFPDAYALLNEMQLSSFASRWSKYLLMFLLLLPATVLFGALFPVALKLYSGNLEALHCNLGKAYAVNIVAGIVGSVLAGFVFIPYFSTDVLLSLMAFFVFITSALFLKEMQTKKAILFWCIIFTLLLLCSKYLAHIDYKSMINIVLKRDMMHTNKEASVHFLKEGRTGIISVISYPSDSCKMILLNNGLSESWVDICNKNNMLLSEFLLGEIPVLLNPSSKKAFVVGYGAGTTLQALSMNSLESIDVVELEPAVLEAVSSIYGGVLPTKKDPRIHVSINDARNTLLMSKERFDIIVSQPSHPWLAGASNIMNKDFFEIVKSKLSDGGIYAQWVPLFTIDVATLKSIIKAYTDTFEYVISFVNLNSRDFMMFGSNEPIDYNTVKISQLIRENNKVGRIFKRHAIYDAFDLLKYFALSKEQLIKVADGSIPSTDTNLLAETFYGRYKDVKNNSFNTLGFIKFKMSKDYKSYTIIKNKKNYINKPYIK